MYTLHPDKIYAVNKLLGRRAQRQGASRPAQTAGRWTNSPAPQQTPAATQGWGSPPSGTQAPPTALQQQIQQSVSNFAAGSSAGSLVQRLAQQMYNDTMRGPGG